MLLRPFCSSLPFSMVLLLFLELRGDGLLCTDSLSVCDLFGHCRTQRRQLFQIDRFSSRLMGSSLAFMKIEAYAMIGDQSAIFVGLHGTCDLDLIIPFIMLDGRWDFRIMTMNIPVVPVWHDNLLLHG